MKVLKWPVVFLQNPNRNLFVKAKIVYFMSTSGRSSGATTFEYLSLPVSGYHTMGFKKGDRQKGYMLQTIDGAWVSAECLYVFSIYRIIGGLKSKDSQCQTLE